MSKSKEELQQLKKEYEEINNKLNDLSEDELKTVIGGNKRPVKKEKIYKCLKCSYYSVEYDETFNHVKNAHNGDSSMIGTYDLS